VLCNVCGVALCSALTKQVDNKQLTKSLHRTFAIQQREAHNTKWVGEASETDEVRPNSHVAEGNFVLRGRGVTSWATVPLDPERWNIVEKIPLRALGRGWYWRSHPPAEPHASTTRLPKRSTRLLTVLG
jgi:hypothetical protein